MEKSPKIEYTRTVDVIALGLLFHGAMVQLTPTVKAFFSKLLRLSGLNEGTVAYSNINSIIGIVLYAILFFLPAFLIFKYAPMPKNKIVYKAALPKGFVLYLIMTIGSVTAMGKITELLRRLLYSIGIGFEAYTPTIPHDILGILLLFVSSAIIPAITEEILFRKVILERLSPYGNIFAVIVSAAAFALMHANPSQTLYAFAGGIFMAIITLKCNSVIPSMVIHASNNSLSIIYLLIREFASPRAFSLTVSTVDMLLGVFGLIILQFAIKNKTMMLDNVEAPIGFSPSKELLRIFVILYVVYIIYNSMKWVILV